MIEIFYDKAYLNNKDCEGINCNCIATSKVKIKAENIGSITLLLCDKCKLQFLTENENIQ
jgi:hypothetical protein